MDHLGCLGLLLDRGPAGLNAEDDHIRITLDLALLPKIIVTNPVIGQRVSNPVTVAGMAEVYESTVSMRLLDAAGKAIVSAFTTADCVPRCAFEFSGPGHGNFSTAVSYRLSSEQPGTVQVFETSREDGSQRNLVNIPVVLAASGR